MCSSFSSASAREEEKKSAMDSSAREEKLQIIRDRFLRLANRLGQTPYNNGIVAKVFQTLKGTKVCFSFSDMAEEFEDFSCTILVLGKTGVGKSSTINSIFDEVKVETDAFEVRTKQVKDVVGTVHGIKILVIDTPGLLPSWSDNRQNEKILCSVKNFIKKTPPDIVLYLDRFDMDTKDYPLFRMITKILGSSIWFNTIVVLTHASSSPPEDYTYDAFVTHSGSFCSKRFAKQSWICAL